MPKSGCLCDTQRYEDFRLRRGIMRLILASIVAAATLITVTTPVLADGERGPSHFGSVQDHRGGTNFDRRNDDGFQTVQFPGRGFPGGGPSGGPRAPFSDGPPSGGPFSGGPPSGGPFSGGPPSGGPFSGGPPSGGPFSGGPPSGGPFSGGPPSGGPFSGGPPSGGGPGFVGGGPRGPGGPGGPFQGGYNNRGPNFWGPSGQPWSRWNNNWGDPQRFARQWGFDRFDYNRGWLRGGRWYANPSLWSDWGGWNWSFSVSSGYPAYYPPNAPYYQQPANCAQYRTQDWIEGRRAIVSYIGCADRWGQVFEQPGTRRIESWGW
jgi:hypothetical protein